MKTEQQGFWEYLQDCKKNDDQRIEYSEGKNQHINGTDLWQYLRKLIGRREDCNQK